MNSIVQQNEGMDFDQIFEEKLQTASARFMRGLDEELGKIIFPKQPMFNTEAYSIESSNAWRRAASSDGLQRSPKAIIDAILTQNRSAIMYLALKKLIINSMPKALFGKGAMDWFDTTGFEIIQDLYLYGVDQTAKALYESYIIVDGNDRYIRPFGILETEFSLIRTGEIITEGNDVSYLIDSVNGAIGEIETGSSAGQPNTMR